MSELSGQPAEVAFTVTVTRKETGKVEVFDMVGRIEPQETEIIEPQNEGDK